LTEVDLSIQLNEHWNQTRSKQIALKRKIKHSTKTKNQTMLQSDKYITNKKHKIKYNSYKNHIYLYQKHMKRICK
jgi:hypothetical protein